MSDDADTPKSGTDRPRLGLALSGGGFRASFFHIGVLARLAEVGLLRQVEVISTVSGGSIIGALYYLHVKRLLETKADGDIAGGDYVCIIKQLEREFLCVVEMNLRTLAFANPWKNLRMIRARYSRSDRMGELYDRHMYRAFVRPEPDGPVEMRKLVIEPKESPGGFKPFKGNDKRVAKVPVLLINSTTLNTGHNWRFEAVRMGVHQRSGGHHRDIDKNLRLLRPQYYAEITQDQQSIQLGEAVAASACVPIIFHPLAISNMYPGIRVQLVDGGVHDNQGVEGLLDTVCKHFIVSDASGQMFDESHPRTGILPVAFRSDTILSDRVREEQLLCLKRNCPDKVALMHLQKGIPAESVGWIGPDGAVASTKPDESEDTEAPVPDEAKSSIDFGVPEGVQRRLAHLRTDLDSFTEVEAYSLMLDGYLMADWEIDRTSDIHSRCCEHSLDCDPSRWEFGRIDPLFRSPTPKFCRQLDAGSRQLFKVFHLAWLAWPIAAALVAAVVGGGYFLLDHWNWLRASLWSLSQTTLADLFPVALALLAPVVIGFVPVLRRAFNTWRFLRRPTDILLRLTLRAIPSALVSVLTWVDLLIFDRLFLRSGRVARLLPKPTKAGDRSSS